VGIKTRSVLAIKGSKPMDNIQQKIAEIEAYTEMATEGPWSYDGCSLSDFDQDCHMTMEWIANGRAGDEDDCNANEKNDGCFIANARTDLPLVTDKFKKAINALDKIAKGEPDAAMFAYMTLERITAEMAGGK
jgi:hypothetical protein